MADQSNLELMQAGYKAFGEGDMATLSTLMADDIVWHVAGDNPLSGDYSGKEAVFGFFARIVEETGGTFNLDIHDILANQEHAVALVNQSAQRGSKTLRGRSVHIAHLEEGKLTEFWAMNDDQAAFDRFWS